MSYMWIVGAAEQEDMGRQSYILYSDTTGEQRAEGQGRMYTSRRFSVFSLLPATCVLGPACPPGAKGVGLSGLALWGAQGVWG